MGESTELHASMRRLLTAAREATGIADLDFAAIGKKLGAQSATMTNWKSRGVSIQGAIDAEAAYGCSPYFILTGKTPAKPPPSKPDFNEKRPTPSQWATIQKIDVMPEGPKRELLERIEAETERWRLIAAEYTERAKRGSTT